MPGVGSPRGSARPEGSVEPAAFRGGDRCAWGERRRLYHARGSPAGIEHGGRKKKRFTWQSRMGVSAGR